MKKLGFRLFVFAALIVSVGCAGVPKNSFTSTQTNSSATYKMTSETPFVIATTPPGDIATNKKIFAAFNKKLDAATVNNTTFQVAGVQGTVSYDAANSIAYFTPSAPLSGNTTYTATVSNVKSTTGEALPITTSFKFTTRSTPNQSFPGVITPKVCIPAGALNVKFTEDIDSTTLTTSTFFVAGVTGTVSYDAATRIGTFTPTTAFTAGATYTATITSGVMDLGGHAVASTTFEFTICPTGEKKFCTGNGVVWHLNAHLNLLLKTQFFNVMNGHLMIGVNSPGAGNMIWNAQGLEALDNFLKNTPDDILEPGQLKGVFTNLVALPPGLNIKGDLMTEAIALQLNIMLGSFDANDHYGHLVVSGTNKGFDGMDLLTIQAILNTYIGTGQLPEGMDAKDLLHLVKNINLAFHGCKESEWAKTHLKVVANIKI